MADLSLTSGPPSPEGQPDPHGLSREQMALLLENSSTAVLSLDAGGRLTYLNPVAARLLQRPRAQLLGRTPWDDAEEADDPPLFRHLRRALQHRTRTRFEVRHPGPDVWLSVEVFPAADGLAVFAVDVTERVLAEHGLREGEHRFRQILDSVQDMVFCKSTGLVVTYANRATCRYYGMSEQELRGITDVPFNELDFTQQYFRDDLKAFERGRPVESEEPNRSPSGEIRFFHTIKSPIFDTRGQVVEIVGVSRDVTERRRAAEALRESEERFRTLTHATADVIWVADPAGGFIGEQSDWAEFTGQAMADYLGWGWLAAVHPLDRARAAEQWAESVENETPCDFEVRVRRADGEYRQMWVRATPVRDANGTVHEWVGVETDVTERRRMEAAQHFLTEAGAILGSSLDYEETLRRVARVAVPTVADWCIVYLLGAEGRVSRRIIAAADPETERLLRELDERFPSDFMDERHPVGRVIRSGEPQLVRSVSPAGVDALSMDGEHRRLMLALRLRSYVLVPLSMRGERVGAIALASGSDERRFDHEDRLLAEELARRASMAIENAVLFREVWDARELLESQAGELEMQAEELQAQTVQLEEARAELEQLNAQLYAQIDEAVRARAEAIEANRAKSDFLASMSHELRTPLNAIGGYVDLLELGIRGPLNPQQNEDLKRIRRNQQHLLRLISDILNFARLEVGQVHFDIGEIPVDATLAAMEPLIAPQVAAKGLRYRYHAGRPEVAARADRERLEQIVLNLLSNAVKFTDPGGRVELSWTADAEGVNIEVEDSGCGIPEAKRAVIFEPFIQLTARSVAEGEGVGLGLAISRDLARVMGGELSVRSEVGRGSVFSVRLPRAGARDERKGAPGAR